MSSYKNEVHFFGEMDLDLLKTPKEIFEKAFDISEACGYMATWNICGSNKSYITIGGWDGQFTLFFEGDKFSHIERYGKKYKLNEIPSGEGTSYGGYF